MKKVMKMMGVVALMVTMVFAFSAFTKGKNNSEMSSAGQYSCKVKIFKPDGKQYVCGDITVFFCCGSEGWVDYWVDCDGNCTITWDAKRGDHINRISFTDGTIFKKGYVIKDIKLVDGGSYKLTAKES